MGNSGLKACVYGAGPESHRAAASLREAGFLHNGGHLLAFRNCLYAFAEITVRTERQGDEIGRAHV